MAFSAERAAAAMTGSIKASGGKILSEKTITYAGCPGREAMIHSPDNEESVLRVIGSLERGYALLYISRKGSALNPTRAMRFLDSFKFDTTGCRESTAEPGAKPDPGTAVGGIYTNKFFGLRLKLPEGWPVQDNYVRESVMEIGRQVSKGKNEIANAAIEASREKTTNLLTIFKHSVGAEPGFNPSLIFGAEDISGLVFSGKSYALTNKFLIQASQVPHEFPGEIHPEKIDGVEFFVMNVITKKEELVIKQKFYTAVIKGYAVFIVLTYSDDKDLPTLEQVIRSAKFEK